MYISFVGKWWELNRLGSAFVEVQRFVQSGQQTPLLLFQKLLELTLYPFGLLYLFADLLLQHRNVFVALMIQLGFLLDCSQTLETLVSVLDG